MPALGVPFTSESAPGSLRKTITSAREPNGRLIRCECILASCIEIGTNYISLFFRFHLQSS